MSSKCFIRYAAFSSLFVSLALDASGGENANTIVNKADALIRGARTYQAVMVTSATTPSGNFAMKSEWKVVPLNHKVSIKMDGNLYGDPLTTTVIDNGMTLYTLNRIRNVYSKSPNTPMRFAYPLRLVSQMLGDGEITYLKTGTLLGRKVHVLKKRVSPRFGLNMDPTVLLYFDQATGRFVQMSMFGKVSIKPGAPREKMELTVSVRNEVINSEIPESEFRFIPPPGAKETPARGLRLNPMGPMVPGIAGVGRTSAH